jgi:hypothetical protein
MTETCVMGVAVHAVWNPVDANPKRSAKMAAKKLGRGASLRGGGCQRW